MNVLSAGTPANANSGFLVNRSMRMRSAAGAYLSRTPAAAGNQKTWTWSAWLKRGSSTNNYQILLGCIPNTSAYTLLGFTPTDNFVFWDTNYSTSPILTSTAVYRDFASWYHFVVRYDTTQATGANRIRLQVNGIDIVSFSVDGRVSLPINSNGFINSTNPHTFSSENPAANSYFYDGLVANEDFIDGQALDASYFGAVNPTTGQWLPKRYVGSYGTCGYRRDYSENNPSTNYFSSAVPSCGYGGIATNGQVADGAMVTSNMSAGSTFAFLTYDLGVSRKIASYSISSLSFSGGSSTFQIYVSNDPTFTTYVSAATLSVNSAANNYSGSTSAYGRYVRLVPTAFGTNGVAAVDSFTFVANTVGLGADSSGNNNYWLSNNVSLVNDSTNDSFTDVPTLTSATASNFCTWDVNRPNSGGLTYNNSNLDVTMNTTGGTAFGTIGVTSGKWYWEVTATSSYPVIGVVADYPLGSYSNTYPGIMANSVGYYANGTKFHNAAAAVAYGATFAAGDVIGICLDLTNGFNTGTVTFYKNNVSQGSITLGFTSTTPVFPAIGDYSVNYPLGTLNCGQRPLAYAPPSGALLLNTFNLPDPVIKKPNQYFDVVARNGVAPGAGSITSLNFQPDLIWDKIRSSAGSNYLIDSVRGINKNLLSDSPAAESTLSTFITALSSNGYSLGAGDWGTSSTIVDWCWKKGAIPGFDIQIANTGASTPAVVTHSLGVKPDMYIAKVRGSTSNWIVWHKSLASQTSSWLTLNTTNAVTSTAAFGTPTSTQVSFNPFPTYSDIVVYLWAEVPGFSKFGKYIGSSDVDGPFVYCGFRPKFIMFKRTDAGAGWEIIDTTRDTYNTSSHILEPSSNIAESTSTTFLVDVLTNGFKLKGADNWLNASGGTYIFAAFAENPLKYANAR